MIFNNIRKYFLFTFKDTAGWKGSKRKKRAQVQVQLRNSDPVRSSFSANFFSLLEELSNWCCKFANNLECSRNENKTVKEWTFNLCQLWRELTQRSLPLVFFKAQADAPGSGTGYISSHPVVLYTTVSTQACLGGFVGVWLFNLAGN